MFPYGLFQNPATALPDYVAPETPQLHYIKMPTQIVRMVDFGLEGSFSCMNRESSFDIFCKVQGVVDEMKSRGIGFPEAPTPDDTRTNWVVLKPGNIPQGGLVIRNLQALTESQYPFWFTVDNLADVSRCGWTIPIAHGQQRSNWTIFLAPTYGMVSRHGHPCITMRMMHDMGGDTSTTEEVPHDEHLQSCPLTSLDDGTPVVVAAADVLPSDVVEPSTSSRSSPITEFDPPSGSPSSVQLFSTPTPSVSLLGRRHPSPLPSARQHPVQSLVRARAESDNEVVALI
ncbi:hypothetical protein PM082_024299 [Marasmius tenuissimus]|nr:hypothetical protein PM082_024299 [Marasmius tenuissimus]